MQGMSPDDMARLHLEAGRPDLQRTRGLTVPAGPVLLTGYSQGSVIAPAVIAQLPAEVRAEVALLTLACPARVYTGERSRPTSAGASLPCWPVCSTRKTRRRTPGDQPGRWKNLRRRSDYIGSWIFAEPQCRLDAAT